MKRLILSSAIMIVCSLSGVGQAPACPSGTLANVFGSSCTIGNLTFNFQNDFQGFAQTTDLATNTVSTVFFGPDAIGFTPVISGNLAGFQLITNFADNANGSGLFLSSHAAHFSYSAQVNGAFEIVGESSTLAGSITQVNNDNISAIDSQCFTNGQCIQLAPAVNFAASFGISNNNPTASATLAAPALAGTGSGGISSFTTAVNSFAFLGDTAILNSASFLYTVAPQIPFPPPANLQYKIIDAPGELATFAFAINDHGDIAGAVLDFAGNAHGYVTDREGENLRLVDFPGATLTNVSGMNDRGDIVGQYLDNSGTSHGYSLIDGVFSTVDFPNSIFDAAVGINDSREIAGIFQGADFSIHGYRLADGVFTAIDDPDAPAFNAGTPNAFTITEVSSINTRGDVAGFFLDTNDFGHSFLLSGGVFQPILVPAGVQGTIASGLNNSGDVVGTFSDISGVPQGFLQNHQGITFVNFPNAVSTNPNGINSYGRIVGFYFDTTGFTHSFFAEKKDDAGNSSDVTVATTPPPAAAANGAGTINPTRGINPCVTSKPVRPDPVTKLLSCQPR
jgi:hypothetical protein